MKMSAASVAITDMELRPTRHADGAGQAQSWAPRVSR